LAEGGVVPPPSMIKLQANLVKPVWGYEQIDVAPARDEERG
jgi:hypothetical protein